MTTAIVQLDMRSGIAAAWTAANPVLKEGELGYESDTNKYKWGDGSTAWNSLTYDAEFGNVIATQFTGAIDGILGAVTPAAATVTEFTSNGIDDNATGTVVTLEDALASFSVAITTTGGVNRLTTSDGFVDVSAGASPSADQILVATAANAASWQTPNFATNLTTVKVITTSYTAADKTVILVDDDTAGAGVAVTLPAAIDGLHYIIKKLGTTANVTITGASSGSAQDPLMLEYEPTAWPEKVRPASGTAKMREDNHWSTKDLEMYVPGCDVTPRNYTKYLDKLKTPFYPPRSKPRASHGGRTQYFGGDTDRWMLTWVNQDPAQYTNWTMCAFCTPGTLGTITKALMSHTKNQTGNHRVTMGIYNGSFNVFDWWNGNLTVVSPKPVAGQRSHYGVTYDGTTLRVYVDGAEVASRALSAAQQTNRTHIFLGMEDLTYAEEWNGYADEFRYYKRTLTAAEMFALSKNRNISLVPKQREQVFMPAQPSGTNDPIDGGQTAVVTAQYETIDIVSDGTEWYVI